MKPAADAILIDSTGMSVEEVVEALAEHVGRPPGMKATAIGESEASS
jgi:cytidylate kinase